MENTIQKYELDQNGKKYILSIQVEGEYLLLKCTESEILNPPLFIGNFHYFGNIFLYLCYYY